MQSYIRGNRGKLIVRFEELAKKAYQETPR